MAAAAGSRRPWEAARRRPAAGRPRPVAGTPAAAGLAVGTPAGPVAGKQQCPEEGSSWW